MPMSDGPSVQWSRDTMDSAPDEEDHAIKVLNNASRCVSARKLSMVSVLDEDPPPSSASSRYVSSSPLRDKPTKGSSRRPHGSYQGSAAASLSSMLIDGDFGSDGEEEEVEEEEPPPRHRASKASSRRASKSGSGAADGSQRQAHGSLFGPPDSSIYSPGADQQLPNPHMPVPPTNPQAASPHRASLGGTPQPEIERSSLSKILDKFVGEEESGPIIRNKNYTGTGSHSRRDRSTSAPRRIVASLASMEQSYSSSRNGSRNGRGNGAEECEAGCGEDVGPGGRCLSTGVSASSASDMFAAASDAALSAPPRPPRGVRPSLDAAGSESWRSSCSGAPGGRPVSLSVMSSMTDLHAPDGAREGRPVVVFSSVSALPPLGSMSQLAAGTPPRPRQLRAIGMSPSTSPQPPPSDRVLSRHASPARGGGPTAGVVSRDASPARPVPRCVGSRDASPTVTRPMAATEIVAAAVAQIAAASHQVVQHSVHSPPPRPHDSSNSNSSPRDQVRSALRPPKPMQAAGAGGAGRPAAPSSWDVALRDSSPARPGAAEDPPPPQHQQQQHRSAPLLRSRDNSPLRSLGASAAADGDVDPETLAEMMSGNIAWRLPMRMGVASQNPAARVSAGGGRTSRDASPNSRGMRSLTEEPAAPAPAPAKPPKPLTKPPNWGRGGDPGRGHAPASHSGSGLGNTLPHLVQSHVFMEPGGNFDIVHGA